MNPSAFSSTQSLILNPFKSYVVKLSPGMGKETTAFILYKRSGLPIVIRAKISSSHQGYSLDISL